MIIGGHRPLNPPLSPTDFWYLGQVCSIIFLLSHRREVIQACAEENMMFVGTGSSGIRSLEGLPRKGNGEATTRNAYSTTITLMT